jgi:FkbM family methyltransferase
MRRRWKAGRQATINPGLCSELTKLFILRSGLETLGDTRVGFIETPEEGLFFSQLPDEAERLVFRALKKDLPGDLEEEAFRTALDYIMRYRYPHSMPGLTMPYTREQRQQPFFHPQHHETIADLPGVPPEEIRRLQELFRPKPGEHLLDLGSYIGFGARRWLDETGETGKVCSLEAMPDVYALLKANTHAFSDGRMHCINCAAADQDDLVVEFKTGGRQENSLSQGIVRSESSIQVKTLTGDTAVQTALTGKVDMISVTTNGAEPEAIKGLEQTLSGNRPVRMLVAGWYLQDGKKIGELIEPTLRAYGLQTAMGRRGGLYAWREES